MANPPTTEAQQPPIPPHNPSHNRLHLTATLVGTQPLRYTPAAVPVLDVLLEHQSVHIESGQQRQVALQLKAVGFGLMAEALARLPLGALLDAHGFMAHARNGKGFVLHIQEFKLI